MIWELRDRDAKWTLRNLKESEIGRGRVRELSLAQQQYLAKGGRGERLRTVPGTAGGGQESSRTEEAVWFQKLEDMA